MPLSEKQKARVSTVISDGIDDLLTFSEDRKPQTLTALQLMLKTEDLSDAEKQTLTEWPSSIKTNDKSPNTAIVFAQDKTTLGNVNLIRTLLQDKNIQDTLNDVESTELLTANNEEIKKYIKEQVSQHIEDLRKKGVKPINISATLTEKQYEAYKKHIKSFITRIAKDRAFLLTSASIFTAIGMAHAGMKFSEYLKNKQELITKDLKDRQESIVRNLDAEIAKNPAKEQEIISEHLKKHLKTSDANFALKIMLPRVTDPKTYNIALETAIKTPSPNKDIIIKLTSHATDPVILDAAYNAAKDLKTAKIIEDRRETIAPMDPLVASLKEAMQTGRITGKYSASQNAIKILIPKIKDQAILSEVIDYAIDTRSYYLLRTSIPYLTDQKTLGKAYFTASHRSYDDLLEKTAKLIHDKTVIDEIVNKAIEGTDIRHKDNHFSKLIPKADQNTLKSIVEYAIKTKRNSLLEQTTPYITDKRTLGKILLRASTLDDSKFISKVTSRINELEDKVITSPPQIILQQQTNLANPITNLAKNIIAAPKTQEISTYNAPSYLPTQTSMSTNTSFAINSMLAIAMVLRICGLNNKFTNFSLPTTPIEIEFDHPSQINNWDIGKFEQLLHDNPSAQIIANNVKAEIQQSGATKWTEKDIIEFVNGPKFKETIEQAKQMEANLRRATEADFGIKPAKKKTEQIYHKQKTQKNQRRN